MATDLMMANRCATDNLNELSEKGWWPLSDVAGSIRIRRPRMSTLTQYSQADWFQSLDDLAWYVCVTVEVNASGWANLNLNGDHRVSA